MDPLIDGVELLQANPDYAHVRYPDGGETTVATKHLAPKGQVEVVETLPAPERIPKEAENLPLDTHVSVTPEAEPSSSSEPVPEPQPEPAPVQNAEPAPVRGSKRVVALWLNLIFKGQGECSVNDIADETRN